jgi:hypothetical protein
MDINIFRPCNASGSGGTTAVTSASQPITPGFAPSPKMSMSILITNSGTDVISVEFGAAAVVATSVPILPNDKQIFSWTPGDTFGVIGATGGLSNCIWKLGYGA